MIADAAQPPLFYALWTPALMLSSGTATGAPAQWEITLGGVPVPVVSAILALVGVVAARPLRPRRAGQGATDRQPAGWLRECLVTLIMMILAVLWVVESQPGLLFAFVVSIGLGFSGYALIELMGAEIGGFFRRILAAMLGVASAPPGFPANTPENSQNQDTPNSDPDEDIL